MQVYFPLNFMQIMKHKNIMHLFLSYLFYHTNYLLVSQISNIKTSQKSVLLMERERFVYTCTEALYLYKSGVSHAVDGSN